ncbi:hypothetical protein QCA50_016599 [Cerrena zonata]|uniref:Uncharacterized protein n=1 Tax=Cerrena zonata TaxID=2478898 RepID=A0AAW0FMX8_9APHY
MEYVKTQATCGSEPRSALELGNINEFDFGHPLTVRILLELYQKITSGTMLLIPQGALNYTTCSSIEFETDLAGDVRVLID